MASNASEDSGTNDASSNARSGRTPNKRSIVWPHFERDLVEVDGIMRAICKYCGFKMISRKSSGTKSLRNHIGESCPKISNEDRQRFLDAIKKDSAEDSFVFDPQRSRELMVKWCISAEVAFNKFDDPLFPLWMKSLQPTFTSFGRQTIRNASINTYAQMKEELKGELQRLDSRICFTSDLWTSNQNLGYICLTAHYIDANFVLHKKIINFRDVKYTHTGLAVEESLTKCLTEWGIKVKMFTFTFDNASYNKTTCDLLQENGKDKLLFGGEHLFVRYSAHILNILVQDGMSIVHTAIDLICELIRHVISSPGRLQMFNEIARRAGLAPKSV